MSVLELRDSALATSYAAASLWWMRAAPPSPALVFPTLAAGLELAASGGVLPPLGFIGDVSHIALGTAGPAATAHLPRHTQLDSALMRKYEDYVLGKLYAESSFQRGAEALLRYTGRDRDRGLAFLIHQLYARANLPGVLLSPAVLRNLQQMQPQAVLAEGWQALDRGDHAALLAQQYEAIASGVRNLGEVLGPEDIFELEHGTALAGFSQRLALRQVLQAAALLEEGLPATRPRPRPQRRQAATRFLEEDQYPVGGYASLANRGSMESLLHSQLAYMERHDRPDLFDIKYARDELLYYARDENQFLRRRETFVLALFPDLVEARFKDAHSHWQRIVLLLAFVTTLVRRLSHWLADASLRFEILIVDDQPAPRLANERELLNTLFREAVENRLLGIRTLRTAEAPAHCQELARASATRLLCLATKTRPALFAEPAEVAWLEIASPEPRLHLGPNELFIPHEPGLVAWQAVLAKLLEQWM